MRAGAARRRAPRPVGGLAVVVLTVATPGVPEAAAQGGVHLDAGVSRALPPAGAVGEASSYGLAGLRLELAGPGRWLLAAAYGGLGLEAGTGNWGSAFLGGGLTAPVSRSLWLGAAVTGEAFRVGSPDAYRAVVGRFEPEARWEPGPVSLRLFGFGGLGVSRVRALEELNRLTRFGPVRIAVDAEVESDLWAWGGGTEIGATGGRIRPWTRVEAYRSPDGDWWGGFAGLRGDDVGGVEWSLEGGAWHAPGGWEGTVSAALRVPLGERLRADLSGGRFGPDPLLEAPAGTSLGATLGWQALRFGTVLRTAGLLGGDPPRVRFRLEASDAGSVALVGDPTEWRPVSLEADGDVWSIELELAPGYYVYGFLVDGEWTVPADAEGVSEDEWGRRQIALLVPEP